MKNQKMNFIYIYTRKNGKKEVQKLYIPVQNVLGEIKNSRKFRQNRKTLMSVFAYFLSASSKNLFLQGRLGTKLLFGPLLW